jgi:hypothetical protein
MKLNPDKSHSAFIKFIGRQEPAVALPASANWVIK